MHNSVLRANSRQELELERYFGKIKATFARKFIVTSFDLIYLLAVNLPIFVLFAYFKPSDGFIKAFHQLVEKNTTIEAWRMFAFSIWMCLVLYVYFVLIPSKTNYQTFFSSYLGMKAVTLEDNLNWKGQLSQAKLFRANLIPVFSTPIVCAIFFYCAWITNNTDWYEKLIKNSFKTFDHSSQGASTMSHQFYWIYGVRMIIVVVFFLQIHHLFTVGASTKALNWFTKSNKIIYVNVERALVVMSTEDKPNPNKADMLDIAQPSTIKVLQAQQEDTEELEDEEERVVKEEEPVIDFSENIEMGTEEFLEFLQSKQNPEEQPEGKKKRRKK